MFVCFLAKDLFAIERTSEINGPKSSVIQAKSPWKVQKGLNFMVTSANIFLEMEDWSLVSTHAHASLALCPSPASGRVHSYNQRKGRSCEDRRLKPQLYVIFQSDTISSILPSESLINILQEIKTCSLQ